MWTFREAYVGRSILDGDESGLALFEGFLALARGQVDRLAENGLLRPGLDREWAALDLILIDVGAHLFEAAVSRSLGASILRGAGLERMERATEALFLSGIFRLPPRRRAKRS